VQIRARLVFHTLPPGPDASKLQNEELDDEAVQEILQKYNLWAELSHNFQWDYSNALSGSYFQDNPAAT
jgi:flap endonuclease-1